MRCRDGLVIFVSGIVVGGVFAAAFVGEVGQRLLVAGWPSVLSELLLGVSLVGLGVGAVWIRRIADRSSQADPQIWRYRQEAHSGPDDEPRPSGRLPEPIRRRLTLRWVVTRTELTLGVLSTTLTVWLVMFGPFMRRPMLAPSGLELQPIAGAAGCLVGLAWMIRIARADPEAGPSIWRSRDD